MKIEESVALVTGANRGIGKALVDALLSSGASRIYAAGRTLPSLESVTAIDPKRIIPLELDITDKAQLSLAAAKATDITLLMNNAGVLDFGSVLDAPSEAFERNLAVNFFGLLNTTRSFAPILKANGGGAVVNLLTLVALASMPGLGVYNASKAAAWSLTQSLRADLAKQGTKVIGVFPGAVDTEMLKGVEMPKAAPEQVAQAVIAGLESDLEDIFPDPMSTELYGLWKADHKAIERQFAMM